MDCLISPIGKWGWKIKVTKEKYGYLESDGNEVIILTPLQPVQGRKDEKKLMEYLDKNRKKIANEKKIDWGTPVSDGHIVYIIYE